MFERLVAYLDSIKARDPAPQPLGNPDLSGCLGAVLSPHRALAVRSRAVLPLARLVNHWSRMVTGIDIHPGAKIGKNFSDHGFSVIGETAEIGDNVTMYQHVTLGGTNPTNGVGGKRHPTIEDDVILGSGAQVIGPVTVGRRARIGANAVVTDEVPEGATMIGLKARSTLVPAEEWMKEFVPYGTPCEDAEGNRIDCIEKLESELRSMREEIAALRAEREPQRRSGTAD